MPEERYLTERIKYYTEVFRLVWVSALAIGGGSVGLLLGEPTVLRVVVGLVSPSGMVETPRLQAKYVCHSEAEPKNLNALTETLRFAQGDSLGGGFERVGFQPTCIEPLGLKPRVV